MTIRFLIANAYGGGGTIHTTLTMASALARRGHDVEVASVFRRRGRPLFPVDPAVRLRALVDRRDRPDPSGSLDVRARVRSRLRRTRSRLIHHDDSRYRRFDADTDVALWRYLRSLRGGVLITTRVGLNLAAARFVHPGVVRVGQEHVYLERHSAALRAAFVRHYPLLDAVVTLTEQDADAYRTLLGDSTRVLAIPNALPEQEPGRATPDHDARVAIAAGRLTHPKGFDLLIDAWGAVAFAHPEWRLRIFGRGGARKQLERRIRVAGLDEQVQLLGFTTTLQRQLASSSMYVMSSRFEGFSMVLLEAMGCGLPVISFDCPTGPAELIDDGVTGLLVPNGSVDDLARGINRLIDDPGLRRRLGRAALQASAEYATDRIAERWEALFAQLGAAKATSGG